MDGNNVKKYDENGKLSYRIYSSPAAACLSLQRLGRRSTQSARFHSEPTQKGDPVGRTLGMRDLRMDRVF